MPIPLDQFFSVAPDTNFLACGYALLGTNDVIFYVSTTNELRVLAFGSSNFTTLVEGVVWVDVVAVGGTAHVYYIDLQGFVWHFQYDGLGPIRHPVTRISGIPLAVTISVVFAHTATPNVYCMILDDGQTHWLFVSQNLLGSPPIPDPAFTSIANGLSVYSNSIDTTYYVSKPVIKIHPSDTNRGTVAIQRQIIQSGLNEIGFYVVTIPGVL